MIALETPLGAEELGRIARSIRRQVIELAYSSKSGHIGSSLSCVDLLVAVYFAFLRLDPREPLAADRDRFIMSKGHACVPYYACLSRRGFLPEAVLSRYGEEGGLLGHHPHKAPEWGIEVSTGSLGHGLSIGAGLAFAAQLSGSPRRTVVMMSDGEQEEGATWEAGMFASQQGLENLLGIVDFNHMQALGDTKDIIDLEPLAERWRALGWGVRRIDGHDIPAILSALSDLPFQRGRPSMIVADTVKGKGVSFMERSLLWHYRCPDAKEYAAALAELDHA